MAKPRRGDVLELDDRRPRVRRRGGRPRSEATSCSSAAACPGDRCARGHRGALALRPGVIEAVETPPPTGSRRPAPISGAAAAAGCSTSAYPAQLAFKEKQVRDCLTRSAGWRRSSCGRSCRRPSPTATGTRWSSRSPPGAPGTRRSGCTTRRALRRRPRHRALPAAVGDDERAARRGARPGPGAAALRLRPGVRARACSASSRCARAGAPARPWSTSSPPRPT